MKRIFFNRSAEVVAAELLGLLLVCRLRGNLKVGRIVETEAYPGRGDKGSHTYRGMTKRNKPMFGLPGKTYVYFTYGMHWMLNVVSDKEGTDSAVLIRAVEPLFSSDKCLEGTSLTDRKKMGSGPARLTKWFGIDGKFNQEDLVESEELYITDSFLDNDMAIIKDLVNSSQIKITTRIGIERVGPDAKRKLRFYIDGNKFISKA